MYSYSHNYPNYQAYGMPNPNQYQYSPYYKDGDDRFIGAGLLAPFLLGGLAGAAIAPAFYRPYPIYPYAPYPYPPYPYRYW